MKCITRSMLAVGHADGQIVTKFCAVAEHLASVPQENKAEPPFHVPPHRPIDAVPTGAKDTRRFPPRQPARPARKKAHHGHGDRPFAIAPRNVLRHHAVLRTRLREAFRTSSTKFYMVIPENSYNHVELGITNITTSDITTSGDLRDSTHPGNPPQAQFCNPTSSPSLSVKESPSNTALMLKTRFHAIISQDSCQAPCPECRVP